MTERNIINSEVAPEENARTMKLYVNISSIGISVHDE